MFVVQLFDIRTQIAQFNGRALQIRKRDTECICKLACATVLPSMA